MMPYISENIRLSETQDRRRKLTTEDKKDIVSMYKTGNYSLNSLAKLYGVCKKTILLTVNPESMETAKRYRKENWQRWQRTGVEWNAIQKEHRKYKQELYLEGKLR